jgi:rfaE bifunctional protein kinase chain/domain
MNHPILQLVSSNRLLVVGDVMLDDDLWGSVRRICPEAPVPVVESRERSCRPGGAANAACNIAALGARAYRAGVTGADEAGQRLRTALAEANVDAGGLIACDDRPTTAKLRVIAHNQQVLRIDSFKCGMQNAECGIKTKHDR